MRVWAFGVLWSLVAACGPAVLGPADLRVSGCRQWVAGVCWVDPAAEARVWSFGVTAPRPGTGWSWAPEVGAWWRPLAPGEQVVEVPVAGGVRVGAVRARAWSAEEDPVARADAGEASSDPAVVAVRAERALRAQAAAGAPEPSTLAAVTEQLRGVGLEGVATQLDALGAMKLLVAGRYGEVEAVLARMAETSPPTLEAQRARARLAARLAARLGDIRQARAQLTEAVALDGGLPAGPYRLALLADLHDVLMRSSDFAAALDAARGAYAAATALGDGGPAASCALALQETNLGYTLWAARDAGFDVDAWLARTGTAGDVVGWHRSAEAHLSPACANYVEASRVVTANLALAWVEAGRWSEASALLARAPRDGSALAAVDLARAEGRLAAAQGRHREALAAFEEMERVAFAVDPVHGVLDALQGEAEARVALGQRGEALELHARAEEVASTFAPLLPLHGGRDRFLAQRQRATEARVALLLELGRTEEALAAVRRLRRAWVDDVARARGWTATDPGARAAWEEGVRRYLALRERVEAQAAHSWTLRVSELGSFRAEQSRLLEQTRALLDDALPAAPTPSSLPALPPGAARVTWFPEGNAWRAFVEAGATVAARSMRAGLPAAGERPLVPGGAGVVLVLPWGPLRDLDLQLAPWSAGVAPAGTPMRWSLDLARPARATASVGALWVADPRRDLPAAREEVRTLRNEVVGAGGVWLEGEAATRSVVMAQLAEVSLFHFAGHGDSNPVEGEPALRLAGADMLLRSDVLSLASAPRRVVLSGCETARGGDAPIEGIGLAQAFVIAGAEAVVGSVRPVDDAQTARFMAALYGAGFAEGDPARAFALAASTEPGAAGFRLLTP